MLMWWVDLGHLPDTHPVPLSFTLLKETGGENEMQKLVGQGDKDREITY